MIRGRDIKSGFARVLKLSALARVILKMILRKLMVAMMSGKWPDRRKLSLRLRGS